MKIDKDRIARYLDQIASELTDIESILADPDTDPLQDPHLIKSLKYSIVVIAEAIAGILQHILAKQHNTVVGGYSEVFRKSRDLKILPNDLLSHLQPFVLFRNMLVHQYWRVENNVFLDNLRTGIEDIRLFVKLMSK